MNGLKLTRIRCNFSVDEIAAFLGIGNSEVAGWENGAQEIPEESLSRLADFFGIGEEYLGEISEEQKQYLFNKAMFRHQDGDKFYYNYHPVAPDENGYVGIFFPGESELTLDEEHLCAKAREKAVLAHSAEIIDYYEAICNEPESKNSNLNQRCRIYERFNQIMDGISAQKPEFRVPYIKQIESILLAVLLAHGFISEEDAGKDSSTFEDDNDLIMSLSQVLREDWNDTETEINDFTEAIRKNTRSEVPKAQEASMTMDEKIAYAENKKREYMESEGLDYTCFLGLPNV